MVKDEPGGAHIGIVKINPSVGESKAPSATSTIVALPSPGSGPSQPSAATILEFPNATSLAVAVNVVSSPLVVGFGLKVKFEVVGPAVSTIVT